MISYIHRKSGSFPSRSDSGRRRLRFNKNRLPGLLMVVLLCYLLLSFFSQFHRLDAMQQDLQQLQAQLTELQKKNAELKQQLKLVQSDAYIEQVARERLGLVKPGEARIVPVKPGN
ncbi:cell division protein FtsL [Desulfofundulus luciae]|uniref:Cell division protein FtsL n=1 Tax=Desulfofundulus luciae TaxID=74702 RepID=A0ABU0AY02_9FIRM|nr:septum formation initiator family protein [Desulfofundulus luciae]MDQ0285364.1 cell division protein FtsL [Desulfofundulus luciae]